MAIKSVSFSFSNKPLLSIKGQHVDIDKAVNITLPSGRDATGFQLDDNTFLEVRKSGLFRSKYELVLRSAQTASLDNWHAKLNGGHVKKIRTGGNGLGDIYTFKKSKDAYRMSGQLNFNDNLVMQFRARATSKWAQGLRDKGLKITDSEFYELRRRGLLSRRQYESLLDGKRKSSNNTIVNYSKTDRQNWIDSKTQWYGLRSGNELRPMLRVDDEQSQPQALPNHPNPNPNDNENNQDALIQQQPHNDNQNNVNNGNGAIPHVPNNQHQNQEQQIDVNVDLNNNIIEVENAVNNNNANNGGNENDNIDPNVNDQNAQQNQLGAIHGNADAVINNDNNGNLAINPNNQNQNNNENQDNIQGIQQQHQNGGNIDNNNNNNIIVNNGNNDENANIEDDD
ncbi:MAG: hypothetical protein KDJ99_07355 [Candidatus Competibacteraceae bacterium]|nr:hypothetical protein [Candidatus Competibacteraceae bacterium]